MSDRTYDVSPRLKARIAGLFYLLSVLTAIFAEAFIHGRLLYAAGLVPVTFFAAVTLLLYGIFKAINKSVALFAATFNLVGLFSEALERHIPGVNAALMFHGVYCLLIGYLAFRSRLLPRIFGVLMALAGLAWLLTSLPPHLGQSLHSYTQALGFFGEGSLMLWLLVVGVNVQVLNLKPDRA
jgi:hypothetical protein